MQPSSQSPNARAWSDETSAMVFCQLYSVRGRLFALPGETLAYPAHDYQGRRVSSIAQEQQRNPRLGGGRSRDSFIELMDNLDLPYPRLLSAERPAGARASARVRRG